jgi:hypothetical protein
MNNQDISVFDDQLVDEIQSLINCSVELVHVCAGVFPFVLQRNASPREQTRAEQMKPIAKAAT